MLRDTAAMLRAEGKLKGSAKKHLIDGFVPQGISAVQVLHKDVVEAALELTDFDGNTRRVTMRWEEEQWRLHLMGADAADAATVALQ